MGNATGTLPRESAAVLDEIETGGERDESALEEGAEPASVADDGPLLKPLWIFVMLAGYTLLYGFARWYEGTFGWAYGLDAYAPEFETYWMNFMYLELMLEVMVGTILCGWLWRTRDRELERYWLHFMELETLLTRHGSEKARRLLLSSRGGSPAMLAPREELRRNLTHLVWLMAYAWAFYWGASFFTEQDATWHQTVVRDTDFTPSHIIVFYFSYPAYIITGFSAFLYARTRLPYFAKGLSVPYLLAVVGPFTILPNVGLNEWGHTFWFMEEVFVAPLHYGFVVFGWFALAVFGVLLQALSSIAYLIRDSLEGTP